MGNSRNKLKKHSVTKNCSDLSLFEQIVLVISKILQILSLQPRISKVFLDHESNFFSQQVRTILVTKYHFGLVWLVKSRYLVSMICSALFINGVSAWAFILKYRARVIIIHNLLVLFPPQTDLFERLRFKSFNYFDAVLQLAIFWMIKFIYSKMATKYEKKFAVKNSNFSRYYQAAYLPVLQAFQDWQVSRLTIS